MTTPPSPEGSAYHPVPEEDDIYDAVRKFREDHPEPPPASDTPTPLPEEPIRILLQQLADRERELTAAMVRGGENILPEPSTLAPSRR
jgi:FixJ family two-component response regulator